jgi:hypothetical protein
VAGMNKEIKYPSAKSHRFLHAAPQFRPIRRGARRKGIEREYISKDGLKKLTIYLFYELDIADQDLLLCLIGMLLPKEKGRLVKANPSKETSLELRKKLDLDGCQVSQMDTLKAATTGYELLTELGRNTGKSDYQWLEKSLDRLALVQFKFDNGGMVNNFKLLSRSYFKNEKGTLERIEYCVNPYSAGAVMGGGYVLQHRGERSQLKKEEAKALHSVLSGLVDMGAERVLNVDMLADKVYSRYDEEITPKAKRSRRESIVKACSEINNIKYWSCSVIGSGINAALKIKRKRRKDIED